jgi:hypothetical protein
MSFLKKIIPSVPSFLKNTKYVNVLHNRFILYFIFLISIGNLYYLTVSQDIMSVVVFIIVGFLTSFFSKNMMVILFIAVSITNILKYGSGIRVSEGFAAHEMKDDAEKETADKETDQMVDKKTDKKADKKSEKTSEKMTTLSPSRASDEDEPTDLQKLQTETTKMLTNMAEITPLLKKAETFIDKSLKNYNEKS